MACSGMIPESTSEKHASWAAAVKSLPSPTEILKAIISPVDEKECVVAVQKLAVLACRTPFELTDDLLKTGILVKLVELLQTDIGHQLKFAILETFKYFSIGPPHYVDAVFASGVIPELISVISSWNMFDVFFPTNNNEVRDEAAWTLVNVIRTRDPIYIRFCVEKGAIQALQSLSALRSENTEVRHLAMIGDLGVTAILQVEEYHKPKEKVWAQQARECRARSDAQVLEYKKATIADKRADTWNWIIKHFGDDAS